MGSVVAFLKTAYQTVKMIKEIVSMFKSMYAMKLKKESEKIKLKNTQNAEAVTKETLKKIDDQNNEELIRLLQEKMKGV